MPDIVQAFRKVSGWYIAFGVIVALGGVTAIARPLTAGLALTLVIGWILILNGVMALVNALAARGAGGLIAQLLLAAVYVLGGVYVLNNLAAVYVFGGGDVLTNPVHGPTALVFVLGLVIFLGGVCRLMMAVALSGVSGIGVLIMSGVLSIMIGVMIWMRLPESSEAVVGLLMGIDFLITGASMTVMGVSGRKMVSSLS